MKAMQQHNRAILTKAARLLLPLQEEFVFLGGLALALLISDPAAPDVRSTEDVDVIVEVASYLQYSRLEERLRAYGFRQPHEEQNIICRWVKDGVRLDIMPVDQTILSFGNRWYAYAIESAQTVSLAADLSIRLISAPCFLATKIEAFQSGTRGDFLTSRDLDDIVTLLDGRPEIVAETHSAEAEVREFIAATFQDYLKNELFLEALEALLHPDPSSQARRPLILSRMSQIAGLTPLAG